MSACVSNTWKLEVEVPQPHCKTVPVPMKPIPETLVNLLVTRCELAGSMTHDEEHAIQPTATAASEAWEHEKHAQHGDGETRTQQRPTQRQNHTHNERTHQRPTPYLRSRTHLHARSHAHACAHACTHAHTHNTHTTHTQHTQVSKRGGCTNPSGRRHAWRQN